MHVTGLNRVITPYPVLIQEMSPSAFSAKLSSISLPIVTLTKQEEALLHHLPQDPDIDAALLSLTA